jgi:uncharacterized membrane protein
MIRFFIIGMMSYIVEVFFTGLESTVREMSHLFTRPHYSFDFQLATQGHVGIFAFFVYCWAAIPFTFLTFPLKRLIKDNFIIPKLGILIRGIIYGLIFMSFEFAIGIFLLLVFHMRAWDYRRLPFNILGVVTFLYLPGWTIIGIFGEWFHERLIQIDGILLNPKGFNAEGIQKGFSDYQKHLARKELHRQHKK